MYPVESWSKISFQDGINEVYQISLRDVCSSVYLLLKNSHDVFSFYPATAWKYPSIAWHGHCIHDVKADTEGKEPTEENR